MLSFSIDGITSFSVAPLRFITFVGLLMTLVSFIMIIFALIEHFQGKTIQGWTSLLVSLWFIGGIITTGVGVTGVYIGKIYTEIETQTEIFYRRKSIIHIEIIKKRKGVSWTYDTPSLLKYFLGHFSCKPN